MNKIAALLVTLTAIFSFSQEKTGYSNRDSLEGRVNELENSLDTLKDKFISDNFISIKAAKEAQELHNIAFDKMQRSFNIFALFVATIITLVALFNYKNTNDLKKEMKEELAKTKDFKNEIESQKVEFNKNNNRILELEKKLKEKIETDLENDIKNKQEKFDTLFRFLSRIYRKSAEEYLEKDNFHEFFYYMHIFYRCLIRIELLNEYDLDRLNRTHKLLSENKAKKVKVVLKNKYNICWFIVYLLKFTYRCEVNKWNDYSNVAELIYNDLFNFNDITYANIGKDIETCMKNGNHKDTEIQEILKLAEDYKDKPIDHNI